MNCPNCGYEIKKPNQKKCPLCGVRLVTETVNTPPENQISAEEEQHQPELPVSEPQAVEKNVPTELQNLCPRCHTPLPALGNFCPNCGFDIRMKAESEPQVEQPVLAPTPQPEPVAAPQPAFVPQPMYVNEPIPQPLREPVYEPQPQPTPVYTPQPSPTPMRETPLYGDDQGPTFIDEEEGYVNGGYYPYPEDVENQNPVGEDLTSGKPSSSTWLIILLTIIGSLLLGILLYFITQ